MKSLIISMFVALALLGCTKSEPTPAATKPTSQPKTQLLKDALSVITKTTNGPVSLDQLPETIRALGPKRALVTYDVLVVYTGDKNGKILNPEGGRSCPAINMFMISPDDEPGVFSFDAF
jgi:ABC-type Fe3+-hydroxamate transport system substrate-binding protein